MVKEDLITAGDLLKPHALIALAALLLAACTLQVGIEPSPAQDTTPSPSATQPTATVEDQNGLAPREPTSTAAPDQSSSNGPTSTPVAPLTVSTPTPVQPPLLPATPTLPAGPTIIRFEADRAQVDPGGSVRLSWEAFGDSATLCRLLVHGVFTDDCRPVGVSDSLSVVVPADLRIGVKYHLRVVQGEQNTSSEVALAITCPDGWFFGDGALPISGGYSDCPGGPPDSAQGVAEHFERGLALWFPEPFDGPQYQIYIIAQDGWGRGHDPWSPGKKESDPDIIPPDGFFQPVRGIGMVWRGETSAYGSLGVIRDQLGWALEPEYPYEIITQCSAFPDSRLQTCYIQTPDGVFYYGSYSWGFLGTD